MNIYGEKFRTDDNGKLYMKYDGASRQWLLLPDTQYVSSGYYYETDAQARIKRAGGTLATSDGPRRPLNAKPAGMLPGDQRFHIIADRFKASAGVDNLVAGNSRLNQSEYKLLENALAELVEDGADIQLQADLEYEGESLRPALIELSWINGGQRYTEPLFENPE